MSNLRGMALIVIGAASIAAAAEAETAAKPKAGGTVVLQVTNSRKVGLKELDVTPKGQFLPIKVLGALGSGKKATAKLSTAKDCLFDVRGTYDDGSATESLGVDLCKDQNVNLLD
jgi:hypothetical protein